MYRKRIMILGASTLQLPAIKKAKDMGLYVIAVDINPNAIGFNFADQECVVSTIDLDGVLEMAMKYKPDGVMTLASDMPIKTVAYVSEKMGFPSLSLENAIKATNKAEMRKCLRTNKIPIPNFYIINTYEEYNEVINRMRNRFIVKPVDNSGSRGVFLVEDIEQAESAFQHSKANSREGNIIIEDYMEGQEVSVETITINGISEIIAITDKLTTNAPYFVEMGHSIQSQLPQFIKDEIEQVTKATISAIGIQNGPSHTEIKITPEGPKIVEIGARLGGDCITSHLVPLATGVDMVEATIKIVLGEKPSLKKMINKGSAIRYIKNKSGIISHIGSFVDVQAINGVKKVEILKNVGDYCSAIFSSSERIGYVIAQSDTAEQAISVCEEALRKIEIKIENANEVAGDNI